MEKRKIYGLRICALALACGLAFLACPTGSDDDDSSNGNTGSTIPSLTPLPPSSGTNALDGEIYYGSTRQGSWRKIEFANDETYKVYTVKENNSGFILDGSNKYTFDLTEEGRYSWNETEKTVTLKPSKTAERENKVWSPPMGKDEYRDYWKTQFDGMTPEERNAELAKMGLSNGSEFLDFAIWMGFRSITYNYAFSNDANAILFLDEVLPENKGSDQFRGQTYHGDGGGGGPTINYAQTYVFGTDGTYTFSNSTYAGDNHSGTYAYDSLHKYIWLKRTRIGDPLEDRDTLYARLQTEPFDSRFESAKAQLACNVNKNFGVTQHGYDPGDKTI